ncbi:hypothetical protein PAXRUDRAFT_134449 [Paxillus rubicundulus Ve08.2h10]|uniref:Uncharacterized protein n=1 Tax=Paxillus rubicundulus Ve08.2h10 TaxID=930991 RepID=A0A0D0E8A0_9AGAM|nr:hypothetical protein PAXRUDRAFT_134449 [Paxillus rubicundulus Ve08.2h10]
MPVGNLDCLLAVCSEQTSPVFFVPKKDGKKQMVQDYQYLNNWAIKNNCLLPLIAQLVNKLKGGL